MSLSLPPAKTPRTRHEAVDQGEKKSFLVRKQQDRESRRALEDYKRHVREDNMKYTPREGWDD